MFLAVDIGNTNITLGVFDNGSLTEVFKIPSEINDFRNKHLKVLTEISQKYNIDFCSIFSVVDELNYLMKDACNTVFKINSELVASIKDTDLKTEGIASSELGADRIANAYGVIGKYQLPAIVIDMGTAITFDIISENEAFIGGVIMPGINLQLNALYTKTSKLPKIKISDSKYSIGKNTKDCILSGVIRGTAGAIDGLINKCELELGHTVTLVATGGDCVMLSKYMNRKFDYIIPNLTLEGIYNKYCFNN